MRRRAIIKTLVLLGRHRISGSRKKIYNNNNKIYNNDRRLIYFEHKSNRAQTAISRIRNLFLWCIHTLNQPYRPITDRRADHIAWEKPSCTHYVIGVFHGKKPFLHPRETERYRYIERRKDIDT